ncbi:MAG: hypothetical protein K9N46_09210 [Candidatus Marinimicrobia bacterium]|nr:hypothetical protein [Candidatus Neomarinimicrobiota bacterium]MCF7829417.1 hypothetical protein [Candidatus Neomarinimicrobiota bacterium]MCF7880903.1 hypothetical protein [Candidatus Neomarinimicrobiota bacterium]
MAKIGVVVLADTETHADLGRVVNAIETVKEAKEHGDDIKFIFDGAGTRWIPELADEEHDAHPLYKAVEDQITGACKFCSRAFGVRKEMDELDVTLLDDYDEHPSLRTLVADGYEVLTF